MLVRQDRFFQLYDVWGREIPLKVLIKNPDLNRTLRKAQVATLHDLLTISASDLISIPGLGVTRCKKLDTARVKLRAFIVRYKQLTKKKKG